MDSRFKRAEAKIARERELEKAAQSSGCLNIRLVPRGSREAEDSANPGLRAATPATTRPRSVAMRGAPGAPRKQPAGKTQRAPSASPIKEQRLAWGEAAPKTIDRAGRTRPVGGERVEKQGRQARANGAKTSTEEGNRSNQRERSIVFASHDPQYICNANEKFSANEHRIIERRGNAVAERTRKPRTSLCNRGGEVATANRVYGSPQRWVELRVDNERKYRSAPPADYLADETVNAFLGNTRSPYWCILSRIWLFCYGVSSPFKYSGSGQWRRVQGGIQL